MLAPNIRLTVRSPLLWTTLYTQLPKCSDISSCRSSTFRMSFSQCSCIRSEKVEKKLRGATIVCRASGDHTHVWSLCESVSVSEHTQGVDTRSELRVFLMLWSLGSIDIEGVTTNSTWFLRSQRLFEDKPQKDSVKSTRNLETSSKPFALRVEWKKDVSMKKSRSTTRKREKGEQEMTRCNAVCLAWHSPPTVPRHRNNPAGVKRSHTVMHTRTAENEKLETKETSVINME